MNALVLLLVATSTLVLRSGDRIPVEGTPVLKESVYTFRSAGKLYSLPASEVDRVDTEAPPADVVVTPEDRKAAPVRRRAVSEEERRRLLAELEKNHSGTSTAQAPPTLPPPPTHAEAQETKREQAEWRREARSHEEAIRRATEELQLLETRVADLQSKIYALVGLGYKPSQFTYDSAQLQQTIDQLPYARLEVTRANRAFEQFREDARRDGVLPGWLR
jgi:hypothetical protein